MIKANFYRMLVIGVFITLLGCSVSAAETSITPTEFEIIVSSSATATVIPSPFPSATDSVTPVETAVPTRTPSETPLPTATDIPVYPDFPFQAPILPPGRDIVDPTYRFATTQDQQRDLHHGVEFLNSQGTPVLAAGDGLVIFSGDDYNGSIFSPKNWFAFYGLFVVIEHQLPQYPEPVYTLYAHLSELLVAEGTRINAGDPVGLVGFTGAAVGSHLHFEVRFDGSTYKDSRNPEIWLNPKNGNGALAGSIKDANGVSIPVFPLQVTSNDIGYAQYFQTYESDTLSFLPPYFENFAIGNLPAGSYTLSFVGYSLERHIVEIQPDQLTLIEITIGESE